MYVENERGCVALPTVLWEANFHIIKRSCHNLLDEKNTPPEVQILVGEIKRHHYLNDAFL